MYKKPRDAAFILGVSVDYLKRAARRGALPEGSVKATDGGHFSYDVDSIAKWMDENFKRQTKISRLEAKA
ncbi:MAG: hypothetical protein LUC93_05245 [Planctomycetaceae bacterium]|nr:hypothetical protein [Planctomycetaceae bacterium]